MKWNDVELVDGRFYFVDVRRWVDGSPNYWVFAYKENSSFETNAHVCAKIHDLDDLGCPVYDRGHVCRRSSIIDLRPANAYDMEMFYKCLNDWGYKYNLNTKKLRHVGNR